MKHLSKIILLITSVLLFLAACDDGDKPLVNTGETDDTAKVDEEVVTIADEFIDQLSDGEYEKASEKFDETMASQLHTEELEELWQSLEGQLGDFIDHEYDTTESVDGYQVVLIKGVFNNADVTFQVTVNENDEIAGFYIQ